MLCRPSVASVYAPIGYGPLPLLAFKLAEDGSAQLAATGSLRSCDPDRIVLKKIVLSGYPMKARAEGAGCAWSTVWGVQRAWAEQQGVVPRSPRSPSGAQCPPPPLLRPPAAALLLQTHKAKAVVRFMFHTPHDIRWFRPVELWTKYGRRGRIREPVGTHGAMKCIFDGPLQQRDTVCMSLYKRVYPKWPESTTFAV